MGQNSAEATSGILMPSSALAVYLLHWTVNSRPALCPLNLPPLKASHVLERTFNLPPPEVTACPLSKSKISTIVSTKPISPPNSWRMAYLCAPTLAVSTISTTNLLKTDHAWGNSNSLDSSIASPHVNTAPSQGQQPVKMFPLAESTSVTSSPEAAFRRSKSLDLKTRR